MPSGRGHPQPPVTGCMDKATWDALSHLYEIFVVQDTDCQPEFTGGWG